MKQFRVRNSYTYTSGRWLRNDVAHQKMRHISFNFEALSKRVVEITAGAESISSYQTKEGGHNRVFVFNTDNNKVVVAKLPFPTAGPARYTTESEVATLRLLRECSRVPVPQVLDWSIDSSNKIGSEYILMEHAPGVPLQTMWPTMSRKQRAQCIHNVYKSLSSLESLQFPAYGCLFSSETTLQHAIQIRDHADFCIGPHVGNRYWGNEVGDHRYYHNVVRNCGPWADLSTWSDGLTDAGFSRIPPHDRQGTVRPRYFGTVETHVWLLRDTRSVLTKLSREPSIDATARPFLVHPDLHKGNLFVQEQDPTSPTMFIDWQSASVEPAFWTANNVTDLIDTPSYDDADDGASTNQNLVLNTRGNIFDLRAHTHLPTLARAMELDESLLRPYIYAHRTWHDGAVALRHDLISLTREWQALELESPCPLTLPEPSTLVVHDRDYRLFVAAQNLKKQVTAFLGIAPDGWIPTDQWELKVSEHRDLYKAVLNEILNRELPDPDEPIQSEDDLRAIWPFDLQFE